jgi:8-oxo-dGTP pyrophosphatase MutT (NUDIX family)
MTTVDKAVAIVVRERGGAREVLAFVHPQAGVQLPRGTVEPGEDFAAAALRELHEESGLALETTPEPLGQWDRVLDGRYGEAPNGALHRWHLFLLEAPAGLPDAWDHEAVGSEEEAGLVFAFRWLPLDAALGCRLHPVFEATVAILHARFA